MVALLGRRSHPSRVSGGLVRDDELLVWPDGGLVRGAGGELLGRQDGDLVKDDEILVWPDGGFVRDNELLVLIETVPIVNHRTEKVRELGAEPIAKSCLERLAGVDLIYVSFDVDSMDSTISMAAGAPAPNGPSVEEARSINAFCVLIRGSAGRGDLSGLWGAAVGLAIRSQVAPVIAVLHFLEGARGHHAFDLLHVVDAAELALRAAPLLWGARSGRTLRGSF